MKNFCLFLLCLFLGIKNNFAQSTVYSSASRAYDFAATPFPSDITIAGQATILSGIFMQSGAVNGVWVADATATSARLNRTVTSVTITWSKWVSGGGLWPGASVIIQGSADGITWTNYGTTGSGAGARQDATVPFTAPVPAAAAVQFIRLALNMSGGSGPADAGLRISSMVTNFSPIPAPGGEINNLQLWVKADAGVITSGTNVTSWADLAPVNTYTVTGTPVLKTNAINFNPSVTFDGSSYFTGNTSIANATEAFAVAKISSNTGGAVIGSMSSGDYFFHYSNDNNFYAGNQNVYTSTSVFGASVVPYSIMNADFSETPESNQKIRINGLDRPNISGNDPVPYTSVPGIGRRQSDAFPNGSEIAEAILYDASKASSNARSKIQSYLALKYGITLDQTTAQDYLASDGITTMWNAAIASYNQNIFGIGNDVNSALNQQISQSANPRSIVTIASENDFVTPNNTGARTVSLNDLQFLTIADNAATSGNPVFGNYNAVITGKYLLNNVQWEVQNINSVGGIYLQFDVNNNNFDVPLQAGSHLFLVYDNSGTIGASSAVVALTDAGGGLWKTSAPVTFSDKAKFTLATNLIAAPGGIAGATLWIKGEDATPGNWPNQGSVGDLLTARTGNSSGTLVSDIPINPTGINFNKTATFNGIAGQRWYLGTSNYGVAGSGTFTSFSAGSVSTVGEWNIFWGTAFNGIFAHAISNSGVVLFSGGATGSNYDVSVPFINGVNKTAGGVYQLWKNGTTDGFAVTNTNSLPVENIAVGALGNGGNTLTGYNGKYAETIIFSPGLDPVADALKINQVNSYLALKYGITLSQATAQDYLASDGSKFWNSSTGAAFNNNIFGIGRDDNSGLNQLAGNSTNAAAADAVMSVSTSNDFANANPGARSTITSDKSFLMVGDNGGAMVAWNAIAAMAPARTQITNRVWQIQNTGNTNASGIYVQVDKSKINGGNIPVGTAYELLVSSSATTTDFSTGAIAITNYTSNGNYITFQLPATVSSATGTVTFTLAALTLPSPGGIDLSNIQLWVKANAGVTAPANQVTMWANQALTAMTTQASKTASANVTLVNNGLNFNPVVHTTGADNDLFNGAYASVPAGPVPSFMFAVAKPSAANGAYGCCSNVYSTVGATNIGAGIYYGDNGFCPDGAGAQVSTANGITVATNEPALVRVNYTNSSNVLGAISAKNGLANAASTNPFSLNNYTAAGGFQLGGRTYGGIAQRIFPGDMAEIIHYNGNTLTTTQVKQVESYLSLKYGITLDQTTAQDYLASDGSKFWNSSTGASYRNRIFGIGRDDNSGLEQRVSTSTTATGNDALLTLATDNNDFTSANNSGTRTTIAADKSFLMIGDDDGALAWTTINAPAQRQIVGRNWQIQATGPISTGGLSVQVDMGKLPSPQGSNYYLLYNTGGTNIYTGSIIQVTGTQITGSLYQFTLPATASGSTATFTIATTIATAPGGVIANLKLWLKADNISGANTATPVSIWTNSLTGFAAPTQGTVANQPIYANGAAAKASNYNPSAIFNGTSSGMSFSDIAFTGNLYSMFAVAQNEGSVWGPIIAPSSSGHVLGVYPNGLIGYDCWGGTNIAASSAGTAKLNVNGLFDLTYEALAGNTIRYNGLVAASSIVSSLSMVANSGLGFGGGSFWKGTISEVIMYNNSALTSNERSRIQSYLALKYGITLDQTTAQDYLASDGATKMWSAAAAATYNNNIFGLGRDDNSALLQTVAASQNVRGIATVALQHDFASANNDASRTSTFAANNSFFTIADNAAANGNPVWTTAIAPVNYNLLSSQWQVQTNVSGGQAVYLQFDAGNTNYDVPSPITGSVYYLVYDNGGTISAGSIVVPLTNTGGSLWSTASAISFSNKAVFTLATSVLPLTAGTTASSQTVCAGKVPSNPLAETIAATGGCGTNAYQWELSVNNGTTWTNIAGATATDYTITNAISAQTLYRRKVTDACGITVAAIPDTIYVSGTAVVFSNQPADAAICEGVAQQFLVVASGTGLSYQWKLDNGSGVFNDISDGTIYSGANTATLKMLSITAVMNAYRYICVVSNAAGCSYNSATATLTVYAKPALTTSADTTICTGTNATIGAVSPGSTLLWTDLGTNSSYVVSPAASTDYMVTANGAHGCQTTATVKVSVEALNAALTSQPMPAKAGENITLTAGGTSNFSVLAWTPTAIFSNQTARTQTLLILDTSFYSVVLKSPIGCLDTAKLKIIPEPNDKDFFVPNAFTPDGDGKNDLFKAYGRSITTIELRVFNQWGQLLFETRDANAGWNGYYKGALQPAGPYIYTVRVKLFSGKEYNKQSSFNLIR